MFKRSVMNHFLFIRLQPIGSKVEFRELEFRVIDFHDREPTQDEIMILIKPKQSFRTVASELPLEAFCKTLLDNMENNQLGITALRVDKVASDEVSVCFLFH